MSTMSRETGLTLCLLGNFAYFLTSADFFHNQLFQKFFQEYGTIRVSNSLDPDQARHFVGPDLGPNYLQRLSADDTSRQRGGKDVDKPAYWLSLIYTIDKQLILHLLIQIFNILAS